jgi:hypothetical protein
MRVSERNQHESALRGASPKQVNRVDMSKKYLLTTACSLVVSNVQTVIAFGYLLHLACRMDFEEWKPHVRTKNC